MKTSTPAAAWAVWLGVAAATAGPPAVPPGVDGAGAAPAAHLVAYLEGLDSLEAGRWNDAVAAFGKAIDAAENDDPALHRARGVAHVLAERPADAVRDLKRALQLRAGDKEARAWLGLAQRMAGDFGNAAATFPEATNDSYETFLGQLGRGYGQLIFRRGQAVRETDPESRAAMQRELARSPDAANHEAARRRLPQTGAWYASRMKSAPEMGPALFARAKSRYEARRHDAALADLEPLRARFPRDMAVLFYHAGCLLVLGDAGSARTEYTQVLTTFTGFGRAYVGRAMACAAMGDARAARADLAAAERCGHADLQRYREAVDAALARLKADAPAEAPEALSEKLRRSTDAAAADDRLIAEAVALRKAVVLRRIGRDEAYQQRLAELERALAAAPGDPDRLTDLAEFLIREARARLDRHVPQGRFRILSEEIPRDAEGEFTRAEKLAEQAFAAKPDHARALVAMARVKFEFQLFADADALLQKALAIREDVPDGLELWARVITIGAGQAEAAARELSEVKTWTTYGVDTVTYWTRYPSKDELRKAEEYRRLAKARLAKAKEVFERACRLRPQDPQGFFDLGVWRIGGGDLPGAREALESAVRLNPDFAQARRALARVYSDLGMKEEAFREQSAVVELSETQVGFLLAEAWGHMSRTAWKSAASVLARAAKADPSDARVPAYLAVVRVAEGKPDQAAALRRMAVAMEEARARVGGTTFGRGGAGRRNPDDVALILVLRLQLAAARLREQPPAAEAALGLMLDNLALEERIPAAERLRDLPTSMLPSPDPEPDRRPEPDNAAALLAWSHLYAGHALAGLRRAADAERAYRIASDFGRDITVGVGQRAILEPRNRAGLALARLLIQSGRHDEAGHVLMKTDVTIRESRSRELSDQKRQLEQMLRR